MTPKRKAESSAASHPRIPMVTIDQQRALQRENAEAEAKFWEGDKEYQAELANGWKSLGADLLRQGGDAEAAAAEADKKATAAKERLQRLAKGEDVTGGLRPFTREDAIRALRAGGATDSDIRHMETVSTLDRLGAYDQYRQGPRAHDRAPRSEKSIARKTYAGEVLPGREAQSERQAEMTPAQCQAARAILKPEVQHLADAANVSTSTIARPEQGEDLLARTVNAVRATLEAKGIEFIGEDGIRLTPSHRRPSWTAVHIRRPTWRDSR